MNDFDLEASECVEAIETAIRNRWYSYNSFSTKDYFRLNELDNGDLNWMLPGKILAMSSPAKFARDGLAPEFFIPMFRQFKVSSIIRLNEEMYDARDFDEEGIKAYDMEYLDGSNPYDHIT